MFVKVCVGSSRHYSTRGHTLNIHRARGTLFPSTHRGRTFVCLEFYITLERTHSLEENRTLQRWAAASVSTLFPARIQNGTRVARRQAWG